MQHVNGIEQAKILPAFVNLIWPLLILSFGPTWPRFACRGKRLSLFPSLFSRIFAKCHLSYFLEEPGRSEALRGRRPSV